MSNRSAEDSGAGMGEVGALFEDLEQQALGLHLRARDQEMAERELGEYAAVTLMSRWHAALDCSVQVQLIGGTRVVGDVDRVGSDWVELVDDHDASWLLPAHAIATVRGLPRRSRPVEVAGAIARVTWRSPVRALIEDRVGCLVVLTDGDRRRAQLLRAGADFVEGEVAGEMLVVPWSSVAAIRS